MYVGRVSSPPVRAPSPFLVGRPSRSIAAGWLFFVQRDAVPGGEARLCERDQVGVVVADDQDPLARAGPQLGHRLPVARCGRVGDIAETDDRIARPHELAPPGEQVAVHRPRVGEWPVERLERPAVAQVQVGPDSGPLDRAVDYCDARLAASRQRQLALPVALDRVDVLLGSGSGVAVPKASRSLLLCASFRLRVGPFASAVLGHFVSFARAPGRLREPDRHRYAPEPAGAGCFGDLPPDRAFDRPLGASDARLGVQMDTGDARWLNCSSPSCLKQRGSANRLLPQADRGGMLSTSSPSVVGSPTIVASVFLRRRLLVVRHVIIFGYGHGLQRAIIDESQHRTPERLIMAQH